MRYWRFVPTLVLATAVLTAFAAEAPAQRRPGHRRPVYRSRTVFHGGFPGPSHYWGPFGWYYGWWGPPAVYVAPVGERVGVRLEVKPVETEVYVDGYRAGTVDEFDGFFQRLNVAPGPHVLELYLEGHQIVREELHASPGTSYKIRHEMSPLAAGESPPPRPRRREPEPAPSTTRERPAQGQEAKPSAPAAFGLLVIHTQPESAEVRVDGEPWPRPPTGKLVVHLPEGPHLIEVRHEGHREFSTEIEIAAGQATPLNVQLPRSE